jgi:hypothetical protein
MRDDVLIFRLHEEFPFNLCNKTTNQISLPHLASSLVLYQIHYRKDPLNTSSCKLQHEEQAPFCEVYRQFHTISLSLLCKCLESLVAAFTLIMFETYNYSIKILSITAAFITNSQVTRKLTNVGRSRRSTGALLDDLMSAVAGARRLSTAAAAVQACSTAGVPTVRLAQSLQIGRRDPCVLD